MKRSLRISVSKAPQNDGTISYRSVGVRERLLQWLFGRKQKLTILIPGESIQEVSICEKKGGEENGKDATDC